jgi:uncharacterized protein (DUF2164 family)
MTGSPLKTFGRPRGTNGYPYEVEIGIEQYRDEQLNEFLERSLGAVITQQDIKHEGVWIRVKLLVCFHNSDEAIQYKLMS